MKPREVPARVRRVQGLRESGASGTHGDRRTKRQRSRAAQKQAAMKEWA